MYIIIWSEIYFLFQIDFQLSIFATPAIDIFYLLYMIASNDTREQHRQEILKYYFEVFQETVLKMGLMGGPAPSLLDFNVELLKNGFLGKYFSYVNLK
jgi:hypothetical protein